MATIAWIEDDAADIDDVVRPLRASHAIRVFTNYHDCMEGIEELRTADLILLDVLLPSGDSAVTGDDLSAGLTLMTELRGHGVSAPVVVLSAKSRNQHASEITPAMDIRDWVQKPVSRYALAERVEAVLKEAAAD